MPAPGQGALAVEVRADLLDGTGGEADPSAAALAAALQSLDDPDTRAAVVAERALLAALEAGCSAPIGALARVHDGTPPTLSLRAVMARPDGSLMRMSATGALGAAESLGRELAAQMLAGPHHRASEHRPMPAGDRMTVNGAITAQQGSAP